MASGAATRARARAAALAAHPTVRSSGWMLAGYAARLVLQLGAFVILARLFGAESFGAFASTLALLTILSPFVELGGYSLVVRDVAAGRPLGRALGNSLLVVGGLLVPAAAVVLALKPLLLPMVPWAVVIGIAVGELFGQRMFNLALGANLARGRLRWSAVMEVASGALRLLLALALWASGGSLVAWAGLSALHGVLAGALAMAWIARAEGGLSARAAEARVRLRPGVHFALGTAAQGVYSDVDKAMLPRLASLEAAGLYGAATRLITVAHLPLNAFLSAVYPKFFEAGQRDPASARRLAVRIAPLTIGYGALATAALWITAPALPFLLGADFRGSVDALRLLAVVPLIQSAYFPFGDALSGSGLQSRRTAGQVAALATNVLVNATLMPSLGWRGAAYAAILTHTVLLCWFVLAGRHPRPAVPPTASDPLARVPAPHPAD